MFDNLARRYFNDAEAFGKGLQLLENYDTKATGDWATTVEPFLMELDDRECKLLEQAYVTTPQTIVNMFADWYRRLGFVGCSSHSGRRTFITNAARKISTVGGSLHDVQLLAGHSNLQTTQRYIEFDTNAQRRVVDLI